MSHPRRSIHVCWLTLALILAQVASFGNARAAPFKEIDLRNMSEASGEYEVSLCARPSPGPAIPGHAFVMYSVKPPTGERKVLSLGFTTTAAAKDAALSYRGWLGTVQGYLGEERYTDAKESCLTILLNKNKFDAAWAVAHPLATIPELADLRFIGRYSLGEQDCMTFMIDVARAIGSITIPERGRAELPLPYVRRLIQAN